MPLLPTPKAWQKLAPLTIESWLVSANERDQQLAEEALQQLGEDAARDYLYRLFTEEKNKLNRM